MENTDMLITLAIFFPLISIGFVLFLRNSRKNLPLFASIASGITALFVFSLMPDAWSSEGIPLTSTSEWLGSIGLKAVFIVDPLSIVLAGIASGIGFLTVIYSKGYMEGKDGQARYFSLILLFIGSMIGLVFSDNMLVMYIFWEVVGLCSFTLIAFKINDPRSFNAGVKAFVVTRIGDAALLLGILLLYSSSGTLSISALIADPSIIDPSAISLAGFLFIIGAMGKSAQFPLHIWLPDAMAAPTPVSALIHAATMVNAGLYLMIRTYPIFSDVHGWTTALVWIGALTALVGAFRALTNTDIKRVLAYSTISQLGYIFFGIGIGGEALLGSYTHILSHGIFKALLFLCAGAIIMASGTRNLYGMRGLKEKMPGTRLAFIIGILSLMGAPFIVGGFWSKDLILASALDAGLSIPLIIIILASFLTAAYAIRLYQQVFSPGRHSDEGRTSEKEDLDPTPSMRLPITLLALLAVTAWLGMGVMMKGMNDFGLVENETGLMDLIRSSTHMFWLPLIFIGAGYLLITYDYKVMKVPLISSFVYRSGRQPIDEIANFFVETLKEVSIRIRKWHTGELTLNMAGFIVALFIAMLVIVLGGI